MKYSTAAALSLAPMAMAKAVRNSYPVRRDGHSQGSGVTFQNGLSGFGITETNVADIIVIWINPGAGAATTTINQAVTVTQTVVVGGGATGGAAPPPPPPPPVDGAPPPPPPAGTAGPPPPGTPVNGALPTHSVTVGGPGGLTFQPDQLTANVGDMVVFTFLGQNHTATQSAFATPCDPLAGGMDSGFMANPNNTVVPAPQVAMQVMVAEPLWFFCAQGNHCGNGMVLSINPTAERTHATFQSQAIAQKGQGAPSAITGGQPGAAPPAAPPAPPAPGAPGAPDPAAPSGGLAPLPGAPGGAPSNNPVAPPGAAPGGIVQGVGSLGGDGSCTCAVSCGAGSFPAIEAQGIGMIGGVAGSLPIAMMEV